MSKLLPTILQTISISTSLAAAGGIATLTFFDVPILQAQPASRSLPSTRWLFSRGSHVFPTAALVSAAGFGALAAQSLAAAPFSSLSSSVSLLLRGDHPGSAARGLVAAVGARSWLFVAAGLLCLSIGPFTGRAMVPNNFALIQKNADKGGLRSADSAAATQSREMETVQRSAADSVGGRGEGGEFWDLSGPQEKTAAGTTAREDAEVREMLGLFGRQNLVRAGLVGVGGVVGLVAAVM